MPSVWHDPGLVAKYPVLAEWARVMDQVGPSHTAANLRGKEPEDAFNQNITAILVQDKIVEEDLDAIVEDCQDILGRPIAK